jgi:hypothetical protein
MEIEGLTAIRSLMQLERVSRALGLGFRTVKQGSGLLVNERMRAISNIMTKMAGAWWSGH